MDRVELITVGKPGLNVWQNPASVMAKDHIHTDVEWNFVLKGAMHYFFAGRFLTLPERQLAVFWGGMPHRLLSVTLPADCIILTLPVAWFSQWNLSGDFSRRLLAGEFFIDQKSDPDDDRKLMQRWIHDLKQDDPNLRLITIMEVEAKLRRYGLAMSQQKPSMKDYSAASTHGSRIERITQFIAQHYQSNISAGDIADDAGLHPKYLMQMFKRSCGMSLWDFVQNTRISHAQRLLLMTDLKLIDIAMDSGFGSVGRFYATFRKVCGTTPRDYRLQKTRL